MNALSPLTRDVMQCAKSLKSCANSLVKAIDGPPKLEAHTSDERNAFEEFTLTYPEEWNGFGVATLFEKFSIALNNKIDELMVVFEKQVMCIFDNMNDPDRLPSTSLSASKHLATTLPPSVTSQVRRNEALAQILPQKMHRKAGRLTDGTGKQLTTEMLTASLYLILEATIQQTNAERAYIVLHSEKNDRNYLRMVSHYPPTEMKLQFPSGSGVCGAVFTSGVALNVANTHNNPWFTTDIEKSAAYTVNNLIVFPIFQSESATQTTKSAIGILQVINSKNPSGFTTEDETALLHTTSLLTRVFNNYPTPLFMQHTFDPSHTLSMLRLPYQTADFQHTVLSDVSTAVGDSAVLTNVSNFRPNQLIYRTLNKSEFFTPTNIKSSGQPVKLRDGSNLKDLHTYTFNLERMWRTGLEQAISLQAEMESWKNRVVDLSLEVRGLRRLIGVAIRSTNTNKLREVLHRDPLTREDVQRYTKKSDPDKASALTGFVPSLQLNRRGGDKASVTSSASDGLEPRPPQGEQDGDKQWLYERGRYLMSKGASNLFEGGLSKMSNFIQDLPVTADPIVTQHSRAVRSPPLTAVLAPPSSPRKPATTARPPGGTPNTQAPPSALPEIGSMQNRAPRPLEMD
eukprot:TRINITY_DN76095_c0_g1_i1.p1 TRINITY_DN76095_c0_g1~~TRINITY_DN76095_c0_g1_i1.p1  ORF type:complete len:638 (+),score=39.35 TRINITY_DN76095_c0_g1_i1:34-1914(+)